MKSLYITLLTLLSCTGNYFVYPAQLSTEKKNVQKPDATQRKLSLIFDNIIHALTEKDGDRLRNILQENPNFLRSSNAAYDTRRIILFAANVMPAALGILKEFGVNIDAQDEYGNTALMDAVLYNHQSSVEALIDAGANMHLQNQNNLSPLSYARQQNNHGMVKALLSNHPSATDISISRSSSGTSRKDSNSRSDTLS
jgi:ankyrin repeat protein